MERQILDHGFGPFFKPDSRILILGSFPSIKSRESQFFYGHPQNRFWPLLARMFHCPIPATIEEKKQLLTDNHIALYDVIEKCSIIGSSDSSIRDILPANLTPILKGSQIGHRIFANGKTAWRFYEKFQFPLTGIHSVCLPSTSPANASYSLDRLCSIWQESLNIAAPRPSLKSAGE